MNLNDQPGRFRSLKTWLPALPLTALLTAVLWFLHANSTIAAIVYLVAIVWFATLTRPALSVSVAVLSSLAFDYFFLEPRYSITINGVQDWLAMVSYVAACIVVSRVAERARRQTRNAEMRRADVERLYTLSLEMMLHEDAQRLVHDLPRLVEKNFALTSVILYVNETSQLYSAGLPSLAADEAHTLRLSLQALAATSEPLMEPAAVSPADLGHGYQSTNLAFGITSIGTLAWKPATLSREVATAVASQVAVAITRAHAIESSARLEAARNTDRLRASLIDSLTHELRTPLTAIRAAVTTLASPRGDHPLDEEIRSELLMIIDEESARLDILIGEAMEMAEIDADAIRVIPEQVRPRTLFEQVAEQARPLLGHHRVSISVEQPEEPVWLDPRLLSRVLRHLLENAARYTPPGSRIALCSRLLPTAIELRVEDNGPGIDPLDLPHIFKKFYRGKHPDTKAKGTGMGLAISRAILTAHGGTIQAESNPGHGTTFRITLPTSDKSIAAQPASNR